MKYLLLLASLLAGAQLPAQKSIRKEPGTWPVIEMGYGRQNQHRTELGLGLRKVTRFMADTGSKMYKVATLSHGVQANLLGMVAANNTFRLGQKLGYAVEYNRVRGTIPWGFKAGLALENYTKKDQRIAVEGGPLLLGFLHLQYGHSIPLGKTYFADIQRNRLSVILYINTIGIVEFFKRMDTMPIM